MDIPAFLRHPPPMSLTAGLWRLASRLLPATKHDAFKIMTALETLTASVNANTAADAELTTAVNAAIVQLGQPTPTDAQLLSLAAQVDANTATTSAQTEALKAAVTPTVA